MSWKMSAGMPGLIYSQHALLTLVIWKFYTHFNIKLVFLLATTYSEIGSVICGSAPILTALIVGRAVAGLGASGILSGALIIGADSVPLGKPPAYSSVVIRMFSVASVPVYRDRGWNVLGRITFPGNGTSTSTYRSVPRL